VSCPIIKPESVTLPLSRGDYLVVKKRLNAGERQKMFELSAKAFIAGEKVELEPAKIAFVKPAMYLLDWSYSGLDGQPLEIAGKPVEYILTVLQSFGVEVVDEISGAINAHENEEDAAWELAKNERAGETLSSTTASSPA
jgi:hypothetical protein